jgi:predicted small metal-binding protein
MRVFRCREVSPTYCPHELRGETNQHVIEQITAHCKAAHGLTDDMVLPAMVAHWTAHIKDESDAG